MNTLRSELDAERILTIWLDQPGKSVNSVDPAMLAELAETIAEVERDRPAGVIFASPKARSFVAGADLFAIRGMDRAAVLQFLADGQALYQRIADLSMPTVAAINGDCLGGGLELALACDHRVAADSGAISIGLPEVKLGILPAWGGTVRLPRLIGLASALPLMLAGKTLTPRKALKAGIIDETVRPEALMAAAHRLARAGRGRAKPPWKQRVLASTRPVRKRIFEQARQQTSKLTMGNYPAPMRLLDVVESGYERGPAAGLEAERTALADLMATDACRNLMRLFFLKTGARKAVAAEIGAQPLEVKQTAVIGGGTMGAGIAHSLARGGLPVRLVEVNAEACAAAMRRIGALFEADVASGRMTPLEAHHAINRVSPASDYSGIALADFIIEAVAEELAVKRQVFGRLDAEARVDAVLASNTSSLRIADMAEATRHPQRVVGLHFFNPVAKMPLVEVVRAPQSDAVSLATAAALAAKIGKTPALVADAPGFLVNRVLIPYLAEALRMAEEGASIVAIDAAIKQWGMPMGPFELLDEIGLDIAAHVLTSLDKAARLSPAMQTALDQKWLGKKTGMGFYHHAAGSKGPLPLNEKLVAALRHAPASAQGDLTPEEISSRLILPMVNEAAHLLEESVVQSTDTIDLATVLGLGLAPFRGGLVRYADAIGAAPIVARLDALATAHGPRFAPAPLLRRLAESNRMLSEWNQAIDSHAAFESAQPLHQE